VIDALSVSAQARQQELVDGSRRWVRWNGDERVETKTEGRR
jgi:hypothetical protein